MSERWKDWLAQAKRDLSHAEKAVKAVFLYLHGEGWGHSVYALLKALTDKKKVPAKLLESAKILDKHYIPARYPNGFDRGIPGDYYTEKEAKEAIKNAREIIKFCQGCIRR